MAPGTMDFERFAEQYGCTAYDALGATKDMTQGDLKRQWKQAVLKAHPDKGGKVEVMKMVNEAWEYLRTEDRRTSYDSFLIDLDFNPIGAGQGQEKYDEAKGQGQDKRDDAEGQGQEERDEEEPTKAEQLERLGFQNVQEHEADELYKEWEKLIQRATWSYWGFWFAWVPITDTMHPVCFVLFFMSGDIGQTVLLIMILTSVGSVNMGHLVYIPLIENALMLGIGAYLYFKQVYIHSETWYVNYVVRVRVKYWLIRIAFAVVLMVLAWPLGGGWTIQFSFILVFRFYLGVSQFLAHYHALEGSRLRQAIQGPDGLVMESRTNLLLYYDSWLNSFLVCMATALVGWVTVNFVILLFFVDLLCWLARCYCHRESRHSLALSCLVAMLKLTSWSAYTFANSRLKVASEAFDADDGKACENALLEWMLERTKRLLERAIQQRALRLAKAQATRDAKQTHQEAEAGPDAAKAEGADGAAERGGGVGGAKGGGEGPEAEEAEAAGARGGEDGGA